MYDLLLKTIGLTKNETFVLEQLYAYGVLTAFEISDKIKLGKNSVLFVLKNLEKKGLVEKRTRNNMFLFQARSPEVIIELYEQKLGALKDKKLELKKIVNHLKDIQNYDSLKKIFYYDDEKSIKRLRAGLIDAVQTGRMKRILPNEYGVEIFSNEDNVYVINRNKFLAVRIQPAQDYQKILKLFKQVTDEE